MPSPPKRSTRQVPGEGGSQAPRRTDQTAALIQTAAGTGAAVLRLESDVGREKRKPVKFIFTGGDPSGRLRQAAHPREDREVLERSGGLWRARPQRLSGGPCVPGPKLFPGLKYLDGADRVEVDVGGLLAQGLEVALVGHAPLRRHLGQGGEVAVLHRAGHRRASKFMSGLNQLPGLTSSGPTRLSIPCDDSVTFGEGKRCRLAKTLALGPRGDCFDSFRSR